MSNGNDREPLAAKVGVAGSNPAWDHRSFTQVNGYF